MENDRLLTLRQASSGALTSSSAAGCDPRIAARQAAKLFGCYRASDANDPETFLAAATAMLSNYPEAIAAKVCDPARGLPSTAKWLPAIAEIREACEQQWCRHDAVEKRANASGNIRARCSRGEQGPGRLAEHRRVLRSFKDLRAEIWPDGAPGARGKRLRRTRATRHPDLKAQAIAYHEARLAETRQARPPAVNTPDMASYLAGMRAQDAEDLAS